MVSIWLILLSNFVIFCKKRCDYKLIGMWDLQEYKPCLGQNTLTFHNLTIGSQIYPLGYVKLWITDGTSSLRCAIGWCCCRLDNNKFVHRCFESLMIPYQDHW